MALVKTDSTKKRPARTISGRELTVNGVIKQHNLPKAKRKEVLEEDEFVAKMDAIIQRDYFPDLADLRLKHEYLEAVENNDLAKMRELTIRFRSTTPRRTPRRTADKGTPANATPTSSAGWSDVTSGKRKREDDDDAENAPKMTLTQFQARYTSEDNDAFLDIMDKNNAEWRQRYWWMFEEKDTKTTDNRPRLTGSDKWTLDERNTNVDHGEYTAKNSLMYFPDGTMPLSKREQQHIVMGPPKEVLRKNTRMPTSTPATAAPQKRPDGSIDWGMVAGAHAGDILAARKDLMGGKLDLHQTPRNMEDETPRVGGYTFVVTPSPAPGGEEGDESPFITWGEIEGTPLLLDPNTSNDVKFKMNDLLPREKVGHSLAEKSTRFRRPTSKKRVTPRRTTPRHGSTPSRLTAMSPAAQRFARSTGRGSSLTDALRASYGTPGGTPSNASRRRTLRKKTPSAGARTSSAAPSPAPQGARESKPESLTDNLLDI